jgi:hypothetical protein
LARASARARSDRRHHPWRSDSDNGAGHPSVASWPARADRFADLGCAVLAGDLTTDEADAIERLIQQFAAVGFPTLYQAK